MKGMQVKEQLCGGESRVVSVHHLPTGAQPRLLAKASDSAERAASSY